MKITPDTNILLRASIQDDPIQARLALRAMAEATLIAVSVQSLCELVWVSRRAYKRSPAVVAASIRALIDGTVVQVDRPVVEAGLAMLDAGGDFADGVIAFEGRMLGGEMFVTFDQAAAHLVQTGGERALVLA